MLMNHNVAWNEMKWAKGKKRHNVAKRKAVRSKQPHLIIFIVQSYRLSLFKHTE